MSDPETVSGDQTASGDQPQKKRSRRKTVLTVGAIVVVIGAIVGVLYYLHARNYESTDDATIDGHMVPISARVAGHVAKVLVNDNQWVKKGEVLVELDPRDFQASLAGTKAALQVAKARRESAGINVDLTTVNTGSGLKEAEAAVSVSQAAVEAAQVGVKVAQAQLDQAKAAVTVAQAAQEQAAADVVSAEAQAQRDQEDLQRYKALFEDKTVTKQQLQHSQASANASQATLEAARKKEAASVAQVGQAKTGVEAAQGGVRAAQSQLAEARSHVSETQARLASARSAPQQIAVSKAQVDVADAQAAQAQAAVDQAGLVLSYAQITAPESGRVTNKTVEEGAYVQPGQTLMTLVPADLWVVANFKETQLSHIQPGQPVRVEVDAYPGKEFAAHVDSIQAGTGAAFSLLPPENATGYFVKVVQRVPVKIVFDTQPDLSTYHLGPGMSVVPTVHISAAPETTPATRPSAGGAAPEAGAQ